MPHSHSVGDINNYIRGKPSSPSSSLRDLYLLNMFPQFFFSLYIWASPINTNKDNKGRTVKTIV